jgi:tRNA A37 threonylcarbamoyladenosine synthetase subunit TsaC/SUA5/YrdC
MQILEALGNPIISTSLPGDFVEDYTDPEIIQQNIGHKVDLIVDGGIGGTEPSTIVDCSTDDWQVVRQGLGQFEA